MRSSSRDLGGWNVITMSDEPTMTAAAPQTSPCIAAEDAITSDFLALVGFASRLGTCVNNDDTTDSDGHDAKSVRDEAMLLMSLLMGEKAEEILSDVKELRCQKRKRYSNPGNVRLKDSDLGVFLFTFPSLSLRPDSHRDSVGPTEAAEHTGEGDDDMMDHPPPSQLLGRTQRVHDKGLIRDSSESMAHNVLESFGAALVWRAKTWIKCLANVLALKEQRRIDARKAAMNDEGAGSDDGENNEGHQVEDIEKYDDLMNSKEMQIIDAIVRSSEEVSVVNIKTVFRVLPNSTEHQNCDDAQSIDDQPGIASNAYKNDCPQENVQEYKVTHKLIFEATISMTSNDDVRYNGVTLQAPGFIQGTFAQNAETLVEGDETLTGVSVTLDTDALAQSLERQSRLVVRQAAEAALMTARGIDSSSPSNRYESPHVHHSIISPRYVLMSPLPADRFHQHHSPSMLPSIPSKEALNGESEPKEASMVSSSEGCSSDSSADTRLSLTPSTKKAKLPAPLSPSFPALLSVANDERNRGD
jgi:hypothetical protein